MTLTLAAALGFGAGFVTAVLLLAIPWLIDLWGSYVVPKDPIAVDDQTRAHLRSLVMDHRSEHRR